MQQLGGGRRGSRARQPRRQDRVNRGGSRCTLGVVGRGYCGSCRKSPLPFVVMAAAEPEVGVSAFRNGRGGSLYRQKATSSPQVAEGLLIVCMGGGRVA